MGADGPGGPTEEPGLTVERLKAWARSLRRDAHAVWLCARDPRTPAAAKAVALLTAAYALSPIDLIPDFIPILGYLDDLVIVPVGLWLAIRLIPAEVLAEHRATADAAAGRPSNRWAAVAVVAVWILVAVAAALALARVWRPG